MIAKFIFVQLVILYKRSEQTSTVISDNYFIEIPSQNTICRDFITPIPINDLSLEREYSLQSPNYPNNYPTNIDCVYIIKAPSPSMIVHLEFRETFEIEDSTNCFNDFLQINDGPFGFSSLISRFCGKEISKETIQSSTNYLWLRFYSDKTETSKGFKVIYKFSNLKENSQPTKMCYRKIYILNSDSVILNSSILKKYQLANDFKGIEECIFDISVKKENNIFVVLTQLNSTAMNGLGQFIEIYDRITGPVVINKYKNHFLINENSNFEKVFLKHQRAVIRIKFKTIESIMTFQLVLTALVKNMKNCSSEEFKCVGSFCILKSLVCNNLKNCPAGDDEICEDVLSNDISGLTSLTATTGKSDKIQEKDHYPLHGFILGSISLLLVCLLIGCIIHSIKQSKIHSKKIKSQTLNVINQNLQNTTIKFEESTLKPSNPSTATLTTTILCKKQYIQPKSKHQQVKQIKSHNGPISIYYKDFTRRDNVEFLNSADYQSRDSCSPECEILSKSISNINHFKSKGVQEHLPGCTSLPNFSTESVKNLFEDDDYPIVEEVTINKPIRMKYYA